MFILFSMFHHDLITKLLESGALCGDITEFGVRHPKQNDIDTQHTRRRLFCVYAILFI